MAYLDYQAVLNSTLYQGQPVKKAILSRIAYLVRDKKEPKGWCTAGQQYLAEQVGCSIETVQKAIAQFRKDGIIELATIRNAHGWKYNRYRLIREKINAAVRPEREYPQEEATRTGEGEEEDFGAPNSPPVREPGRPPVSEPTKPPVFNAEATRTEPGHSSYRLSSYHSARINEHVPSGETPEPPVWKRETVRDIESDSKTDAHTQVCNSEPTGEVSPEPPPVRKPRYHSHKFTPRNSQCTECEFVCEHPQETVERVKGQFTSVCKDCRVVLEDVPA